MVCSASYTEEEGWGVMLDYLVNFLDPQLASTDGDKPYCNCRRGSPNWAVAATNGVCPPPTQRKNGEGWVDYLVNFLDPQLAPADGDQALQSPFR